MSHSHGRQILISYSGKPLFGKLLVWESLISSAHGREYQFLESLIFFFFFFTNSVRFSKIVYKSISGILNLLFFLFFKFFHLDFEKLYSALDINFLNFSRRGGVLRGVGLHPRGGLAVIVGRGLVAGGANDVGTVLFLLLNIFRFWRLLRGS